MKTYPSKTFIFNYCACGHIDAWHETKASAIIDLILHRTYHGKCELCECPQYEFEVRK
jgi:hypothetical protein